ncbi:MAG: hypothetical protein HY738_05520 [Bacteroidia bacterium]|nr:hypothetical protein [Bacteroidia bacterium]
MNRNRILQVTVISGILLITLLLFKKVFLFDFLYNWDDQMYIVFNNDIQTFSITSLQKIFTSFYLGNYHPLTMLTFMAEYKLFGLNPFWYHLDNLILHLINCILVFYFIRQIAGNLILPVIVTLLFAVHPMHVESVAWIAERKDLLYSAFFIGALIFYYKYITKLLIFPKICETNRRIGESESGGAGEWESGGTGERGNGRIPFSPSPFRPFAPSPILLVFRVATAVCPVSSVQINGRNPALIALFA